jgi:hypothetical protein
MESIAEFILAEMAESVLWFQTLSARALLTVVI